MGLIIVKTQLNQTVKEISKKKKTKINNITTDFTPELDKKVKKIIENAITRAHKNKRKTLMARDL